MGTKTWVGEESLITQFFSLVPEPQRGILVTLLEQSVTSQAERHAALYETIMAIDWEGQREQVGMLLNHLLPLESLVPEIYSKWRPLIRAAVAFLGSRLSPQRLVPKFVAQILLPVDVPLAQRLLPLLAQMPTLQKLGQVIARNQHLDPGVRAELTQLENSITDFPAPAGHQEIRRQLASQLAEYQLELAEDYLAEASVSVVIPFIWTNPATQEREHGVFKVLKPYVRNYLAEELGLLNAFVHTLATSEHASLLSQARIQDVFADIQQLLAQEIDFPREQANLLAAAARYANVPGVRIPRILPVLSTSTITASVREPGVKVTAIGRATAWQRWQLARRIVAALVIVPLVAMDEDSVFHADPHAGNLLRDEDTRTIVVLDWALTGRLSRLQRRQLVLLIIALSLRDQALLYRVIATLSLDDFTTDPMRAAVVRREIAQFVHALSPLTVPGILHAVNFLDHLALVGIRFPSALVIFRKALFTLEGVVHDIVPSMRFDTVLTWSLLWLSSTCRFPAGTVASFLSTLLCLEDWIAVQTSLCSYSGRLWQQLVWPAVSSMGTWASPATPAQPEGVLKYHRSDSDELLF
jgi:ubiquinone biosynthesis protein